MPRPLTATIHLDAMRHNLARVRACAPGTRVWAVVKANAYGHGLHRAMRAFADADGLALIEVERAVELRERGWVKPILLLEGVFDGLDASLLAGLGLESAVHSVAQIEILESSRLTAPIDVHLKMNSGMNRLGFAPDAFGAAYARLAAIPMVRRISLMTHFANADALEHPVLGMAEQVRRFGAGAAGLPGERSLCNSGAVLHYAEAPALLQGDWVRPGIMLYGGSPGAGSANDHGLLPAMTLAGEIIGVQQLRAGDAVGYGSRYVAERAMTIGVVACGYADGYPRHAPHGTPVLVDGQGSSLVGRVSMDMLAVDLTPLASAGVGSRVTLWGDALPIDTVATCAGTIGYELMCAVSPRVRMIEADLHTIDKD